jgi:hypothetical protein
LEAAPASLITVTLEYSGTQKRIIKTLTHPDGSKTITTTIEEMGSSTEGSGGIGGSATEGSEAALPFTEEDGVFECNGGGYNPHRCQPAVPDVDYEDEEEKLIACMIRDPPGTTATGRFVAKRSTKGNDSFSEHSVKEIIVVGEPSKSEKGSEANGDTSVAIESTNEEIERYSETA